MTQTVYSLDDALPMTKSMCERVDLNVRAGRYIMFMCQIRQALPGGVIDMVEVAQLIKYVSEHKEDLRSQFRDTKSRPGQQDDTNKPAYFTFLK